MMYFWVNCINVRILFPTFAECTAMLLYRPNLREDETSYYLCKNCTDRVYLPSIPIEMSLRR